MSFLDRQAMVRIAWMTGRPRSILLAALLAGSAACMQSGRSVVVATTSGTEPTAPSRPVTWPLRVREHVDLWLHGFALLHQDSTLIPYFRPSYRTRVLAERQQRGVTTLLDANQDRLRSRLAANPALVSAQFVALYFDDWVVLRRAVDQFVALDGDPRRARDRETAEATAVLSTYFPAAADRDWLVRFVQALDDERTRFFRSFWLAEQRRLGPVFDRADMLWRGDWLARFSTFLANSRQRNGDVLLALALAGEGRTLLDGGWGNVITVGFPTDTASAEELAWVFAHEVVGTVATATVTDHMSPAEQRSGVAGQYNSLAAVRGGAMLLARIAPDLVAGYERYYLALAGSPVTPGASTAQFQRTFALPAPLLDALERQIDIILGGI